MKTPRELMSLDIIDLDPPFFHQLYLSTVNICNRRCSFCPQSDPRYRPTKRSLMPESTVQLIVDELVREQYRGSVTFLGISEPFLDPRLADLCRLFRSQLPVVHLSIVTNGDYLTPSMLDVLFGIPIDLLLVSVYSGEDHLRLQEIVGAGGAHRDIRLLNHFSAQEQGFYCVMGSWNCSENLQHNHAGFFPLGALQNSAVHWDCPYPYNVLQLWDDGRPGLCCLDSRKEVFDPEWRFPDRDLKEIWRSPTMIAYRQSLTRGRSGLKLCQQCDMKLFSEPIGVRIPRPNE